MIANIAFIFRSLVMVLFIDRFIELRMEVSATQLCGNMHKLNRTKRRLYEHLCVDIFLWSHKKFFSALRASVWSINKDPGPSPGSATVTCIDRTGLNSFTLLFIRLRKGEVESKPTLVALSRESGKRSSTGESDGFTDNEYSYTDDDTDGERLVTGNKPPHVTGSADNVRYSIVFLVLQCHFDL